jgi:hypothetical protein
MYVNRYYYTYNSFRRTGRVFRYATRSFTIQLLQCWYAPADGERRERRLLFISRIDPVVKTNPLFCYYVVGGGARMFT